MSQLPGDTSSQILSNSSDVRRFIDTKNYFSQLLVNLKSQLAEVKGTALEAKIKTLIQEGDSLQASVTNVVNTIDNAVDFAQTKFNSIVDWAKEAAGITVDPAVVSGLGFLPLIPAATMALIGGATYTLNNWIEKAEETSQEAALAKQIQKEENLPISEAALIANDIFEGRASKERIAKGLFITSLVGLGGWLWWKSQKSKK